MLDKPVTDTPEMLFLHSNGSFLLKKVQVHFRQWQSGDSATQPNMSAMQALNSLTNAWLFREFRPLCTCSDTRPVLSALKSPGYRSAHIPRPGSTFYQLLRQQSHLKSTHDIATSLDLDAETRQLAANLANHSPFMRKATWYTGFDDLLNLDTDNLLALLAGTLLNQLIISRDSSANELELFYQGVCSGYINMQLGKARGFNPLHCFLAPLLHNIALIAIQRQLLNRPGLPEAGLLLDEIDAIHLKLAYWIAKDWGLPDDILLVQKNRFLNPENPALPAQLLQKSEHAWLAIRLCQQGLLTRSQVSEFLELMQVSYTGLNASLTAINH